MTGTVLERSLASVIKRLQKLRILRRQALYWLVLLVPAIAVTLWLPARSGLRPELPVVLATTLIGILLARLFVTRPSRSEAARLIEQADPDVNDAVLTAVQMADRPGKRPSVLAAMAIQEADDLAKQRDWSGAVPGWQIAKWTALSCLSFVLMVSSVMAASRYGRNLLKAADKEVTDAKTENGPAITELMIEPGDVELEKGSALTVVARFPGMVPAHAVLQFLDSSQAPRQLAMTETVDAGVFAARMEEISSDGRYEVLYTDQESASQKPVSSPSFSVTTYLLPKLDQVDAVIVPPAWSGRPEETIEDVMRLTAAEGSSVTLKLRLNKPVATASLKPSQGDPIPLVPNAENPSILEATVVVRDNSAWTVDLVDAQGRRPSDDKKISIKVTRNEPADIKVTFPGKDTNVSPLQEFLVEANASDDFAIVNYGVQYTLSGGETKNLSLKAVSPECDVTGGTPILNTAISHRIDLEPLNAAPDDLVTYSFWASDIAADGSVRQSFSDLMFAEVRRFEEVFRESQQGNQQQQQQQQQQGQQQEGSAVDGVLKLQKEIVSATWNLIRAEALKQNSPSFVSDVKTIAESQGHAIVQVQEALEKLNGDAKTGALAQRAIEQMASAQKSLESVGGAAEGARLSSALPIEQSVVQTLLKMRAAEFQVQQQQQGGGGGGGGGSSASQQQMQQLELDNKRNRYESEQQASQQQEQTQQQREQMQVLNRLKELARRQQMVNERLKQLESELRTATTDKERQEIERELKRLREEQREMLRDVDEVAERLNQATDQQDPRTAQSKQQMEEARENVQQASRAMDEGRLAEAIAEGTRAERQFEDLKEDFRNQTSSRFSEAVRDLREQAQELEDRQEQLSQQLTGQSPDEKKSRQPSLKSDRDRDQLSQEFGQQKDRLNRVVEQTRQMIEQSEQSEPLLSSKLYDTLRELKDSKPEEALEATEFLSGRGMWAQSQEAERAARRGIKQLREGIDQAADSVLGSTTESLRRAQQQLDDATQKLADEIQNATGGKRNEPGRDGQNEPGSASEETADAGNAASSDNPAQEPRRPGQQTRGSQQGRAGEPGQKSGTPSADAKSPAGDGSANEQRKSGSSEEGNEQPAADEPNTPQEHQASGSGGAGEKSDTEKSDGQKSDVQNRQKSGEQGQKDSGNGSSGQQRADEGQSTSSGSGQAGSPQSGQRPSETGQRSSLLNGGRENTGRERNGGGNQAGDRPLTGDDFGRWSDQLRDVEEMLEDPDLRNRVAQVRDRAKAMRAEFKRHGEMPQWDLVKSQLLGEMQALQQRLNQELAKLESDRAMVPIDRDPVPQEFDTIVQRYYELLGQEKAAPTVRPKK